MSSTIVASPVTLGMYDNGTGSYWSFSSIFPLSDSTSDPLFDSLSNRLFSVLQ